MIREEGDKRSLESRFALVTISATLIFLIINISFDLKAGSEPVFITIQTFIFCLCLGCLYLIKRKKFQQGVISFFSILLISAYVYLLQFSAGYQGGMGFTLQVLCTVIILLTSNRRKLVFSIALVAVVIFMVSGKILYKGTINSDELYVDFFLNLAFLIVLMFFFKENLDSEEDHLTSSNYQLSQINGELTAQKEKLIRNNRKIEKKRRNLQEDVAKQTKQLEEENQRLLELSFINAHLVRAPIANIMGLIDAKGGDSGLNELSKSIHEMDEIVRKISKVLEQ